MENVKDIFKNTLFRIPDYQRGYAWGFDQLEDFWQDINNIVGSRKHYTGVVTVENIPSDSWRQWDDELWFLESQSPRILYVVDGQQRLTTVCIFLKVLIDSLEPGEEYLYQSKEDLVKEYVMKNSRDKEAVHIFGYADDATSKEFYREVIVDNKPIESLEETFYTNNLLSAKKYFSDKIANCNFERRQELFKKLTQQVTFNVQQMEEGLNSFVVFESMNNRGKSLSFLEKLKNRLVYLSTLIYKDLPFEEQEIKAAELRQKINLSWKVIYEYLGKNKEEPLCDDDFVRNHWIMYSKNEIDGKNLNFAKEIYDLFNARKAEAGRIEPALIENYVHSIHDSIKQWYIINNPEFCDNIELQEKLKQIAVLKYRHFKPMLLAALVKHAKADCVNLFGMMEKCLFLAYHVKRKNKNYGRPNFYRLAQRLFRNEITLGCCTDEIKKYVYPIRGLFDMSSLIQYINSDDTNWKTWDGLKYFMFEYERSLSDKTNLLLKDIRIDYICHRFDNRLEGYADGSRDKIKHNLGNLRISTHSGNSQTEKMLVLSHAEEIFKPEDIKDRGLELIEFMESRWQISIKDDDKQQLAQYKGIRRINLVSV